MIGRHVQRRVLRYRTRTKTRDLSFFVSSLFLTATLKRAKSVDRFRPGNAPRGDLNGIIARAELCVQILHSFFAKDGAEYSSTYGSLFIANAGADLHTINVEILRPS